jgi:putative aminopeptidase FrvX
MSEAAENLEFLNIGPAQIRLLERLCNANAVSGDESEVRKIVLGELKGYVDEIKVDSVGNVLATQPAKLEGAPKVMLAAHMDEVGFMLMAVDGAGFFQFEAIGIKASAQLAAKSVLAGKDHLPGVIGVRPIHFTPSGEMPEMFRVEDLRIDFGDENVKKIKPGDLATFATRFQQTGPSIIAKALDNRLGVATLIELVKHAPANITLQAAFTVQEEIGQLGAHVAAYTFNPDLAVVIDSTPAYDLPAWDGSENTAYNTRIGAGPAIYLSDKGTISDPRLIRHLTETGDALNIPYQFRQPGGGGTEAAAIHRQHAGIPSVSVSVPHRYTHSAASLCRIQDAGR